MIVVIGHSGVLGEALADRASQFAGQARPVVRVDARTVFEQVLRTPDAVPEAIRAGLSAGALDVICAAGAIDPRTPAEELDQANVAGPAAIFDCIAASAHRNFGNMAWRFFTFGSIMENDPAIASENPYIGSKRRLLQRRTAALETASAAGIAGHWHHIQLHTLYGGAKAHDFMFLGQMLAALQSRTAFSMSGGVQRREYHHVDDIAENVFLDIAQPGSLSSVVDYSSGQSVRLRDLADQVFTQCGMRELLEIGSLAAPSAEVYKNLYYRSEHVRASRDPVQGIVQWFRQHGVRGIEFE